MGRTQLQDAVAMTLGQEFHAFAKSLNNEIFALGRVETVLHEGNVGGTAVGTGLNAPEDMPNAAPIISRRSLVSPSGGRGIWLRPHQTHNSVLFRAEECSDQ